MKKLNTTQTQYESVMEFALFGNDDEEIALKTLIATTKKPKKTKKAKEKEELMVT